jgi:hypothetical protein
MKRMIIVLAMLSLCAANLSCGDEGQILAGVKDSKKLDDGSPVPFLLYQNYPNPFNPSTQIRFQMPQSMQVRLKVFTDDWHEVETLLDERLSAGVHQVIFNAKDLASGEYYYTMEALDVTEIRKMKLIK